MLRIEVPDTVIEESGSKNLQLESAADPQNVTIIRDFQDPYLELIRLLKEASEIEHSLMIQYLYAAFSIKPKYQELVGAPYDPIEFNLLGIAKQEMRHLSYVNAFLIKLGVMSDLKVQDFPYRIDIYPFELKLEHLTKNSLAKYVYAEASADELSEDNPENISNPDNVRLLKELKVILNEKDFKGNHLGSLYNKIIDVAEEFKKNSSDNFDIEEDIERMKKIKGEGEKDHFNFFKDVFLGKHNAFGGREVWNLDSKDDDYPSFELPEETTLFISKKEKESYGQLYDLAMLGNLHYWIVLLLLNQYFRNKLDGDYLRHATSNMVSGIFPIGNFLAENGKGFPFDNLSLGYNPGLDSATNNSIIINICNEGIKLFERINSEKDPKIPARYSEAPLLSTKNYLISIDRTKSFFEFSVSTILSVRQIYSRELANDFWFDFDNIFRFHIRYPENSDVFRYYNLIFNASEIDDWFRTYSVSRFKEMINRERGVREFIDFIIPKQFAVINKHFTNEDNLQMALEDFGQGVLLDMRRNTREYNYEIIHTMKTVRSVDPTPMYSVWHSIIRAYTLVIDNSDPKYLTLDRFICLAWQIQLQMDPKPTLTIVNGVIPDNHQMPGEKLRELRNIYLGKTFEQIDELFHNYLP